MQCTQILTKNKTIVYSDAGLRFLADLMGASMESAAALIATLTDDCKMDEEKGTGKGSADPPSDS